jgi:hypothetical protein
MNPSRIRSDTLHHPQLRKETTAPGADVVNYTPDLPRFSTLPIKIRLNIWEMTYEEGRHIAIVPVYNDAPAHSCIEVPASSVQALAICKESREAALREYSSIILNKRGDCVFVGFARDTIYVDFPFDINHIAEPVYNINEMRFLLNSRMDMESRGFLESNDNMDYDNPRRVLDELRNGRVVAAQCNRAFEFDIVGLKT